MSDYYLDTKNVREQFAIRVDWDTYHFGELGICHEEDTFFEDRPKEISFYVFKNGDIASKFPLVSIANIYLLKNDGKLLQSRGAGSGLWRNPFHTRIEFKPAFDLRPDWVAHNYRGIDLGPTESFYHCYHGSTNFNQHLTAHQKTIVERFFAAVRATFPYQFARK